MKKRKAWTIAAVIVLSALLFYWLFYATYFDEMDGAVDSIPEMVERGQ